MPALTWVPNNFIFSCRLAKHAVDWVFGEFISWRLIGRAEHMKMEMTQKNRQIWLVFHWNSKGKPQQVSGVCLIAQEQNGCFFLELVLVWFVVLFIYYFFFKRKMAIFSGLIFWNTWTMSVKVGKKNSFGLGKISAPICSVK